MSEQPDDSGRSPDGLASEADSEEAMNDELWQREMRARKRDDDGAGGGRPSDGDTVIERRTRPKTRTKKPPMYKVILLNDDYTPMEFVVEILKMVFHKQHAEATRIMLHVHQNGMGVAGVYPVRDRRDQGAHGRGTGAPERISAQVRDGESLSGAIKF